MPENKQIHDLPIAEQTSSSDLFETEIPSQLMQSGFASRKVSAAEIADLLLNDMTYPQALQTTAKKIIPAINEAAQSGGGGGASANEALPYDEDSSYVYGDYCIQNNYLWRCISTTTVTGAWDATKWIAVLVTNEYKRVRIMNKAAFDLLSADEKDGFIYVSDYPTKIQDVDNVNLTTSDNNKLLKVNVVNNELSVEAVDIYAQTAKTATYTISSINRGSIYAYTMGKLIMVTGWMNSNANIPVDPDLGNVKAIATVSGVTLLTQIFMASNGNQGTGLRLKLETDGTLYIEKDMPANEWFSFTAVGFLV